MRTTQTKSIATPSQAITFYPGGQAALHASIATIHLASAHDALRLAATGRYGAKTVFQFQASAYLDRAAGRIATARGYLAGGAR